VPSRADGAKGAGAIGPDGVNEDVEAGGPEQQGRVTDGRDAETVHMVFGLESGASGDDFGPAGSAAEELPAEDLQEALICGGETVVVELLAVEVICLGAGIVTIRQYFSFLPPRSNGDFNSRCLTANRCSRIFEHRFDGVYVSGTIWSSVDDRDQFPEGFSTWSITSTGTGALLGSSLTPSCSRIAVKRPGGAFGSGAPFKEGVGASSGVQRRVRS
jgi:hypothetical protein